MFEERTIRVSFGTTKYCSFFLRGENCTNPKCLYVHKIDKSENKSSFQEYQREAYFYSQVGRTSLENFSAAVARYRPKERPLFPAPEVIYTKAFEFLGDSRNNAKVPKPPTELSCKKKETPETADEPATKSPVIAPEPNKSINKFGFALEDDSSNNSVISVPEEIESLLKESKGTSLYNPHRTQDSKQQPTRRTHRKLLIQQVQRAAAS